MICCQIGEIHVRKLTGPKIGIPFAGKRRQIVHPKGMLKTFVCDQIDQECSRTLKIRGVASNIHRNPQKPKLGDRARRNRDFSSRSLLANPLLYSSVVDVLWPGERQEHVYIQQPGSGKISQLLFDPLVSNGGRVLWHIEMRQAGFFVEFNLEAVALGFR